MGATIDELSLADWRRQVAEIYTDLRRLACTDHAAALQHWRTERERLFRDHPQSPVVALARPSFRARHFDCDPAMRFELEVAPAPAAAAAQVSVPAAAQVLLPAAARTWEPAATAGSAAAPPDPGAAVNPARSASPFGLGFAGPLLDLPTSGGGAMAFRRIGSVEVPFPAGTRSLAVYWMEGYAGGLFVPFRDATNGHETYAAGRYAIDAAKSADLGGDPVRGTIVIDFNFAYQPSCAFDPRWSCPLAPRENWLDVPVRAGERIA